MELGPKILAQVGPVPITETVVWGWIFSILILIFAFVSTRKLQRIPKGSQGVAEWIVEFVYKMVKDVMDEAGERFAPYMGTLLIFLIPGSMLGLLDCRPLAADLNLTGPLAIVSFIMIHYNAVRVKTATGYIKEMSSPYVFMLPMNILSESMFPITLAMRLFGNLLAGVIVMTLIYHALETLSAMLGSSIPFFQLILPLPLNAFFDLFEPVLQGYIFVMLTMVFTANARQVED